jgi:hypothetical protein
MLAKAFKMLARLTALDSPHSKSRPTAIGEAAYPREPHFADDFMQALYDSLKHRPETTQGTGLADVMVYKDPRFPLRNFGKLMLHSPWNLAR